MAQVYKHYNVICDNGHSNKVGIWAINGELQNIPLCSQCGANNLIEETIVKNTGPATIRSDWRKKIPSDYKNFVETAFKKRHGSDANINI